MLQSCGPLLVLPYISLKDLGRSTKRLWFWCKNLAFVRGSVEIAAVAGVVNGIALGHPDIAGRDTRGKSGVIANLTLIPALLGGLSTS